MFLKKIAILFLVSATTCFQSKSLLASSLPKPSGKKPTKDFYTDLYWAEELLQNLPSKPNEDGWELLDCTMFSISQIDHEFKFKTVTYAANQVKEKIKAHDYLITKYENILSHPVGFGLTAGCMMKFENSQNYINPALAESIHLATMSKNNFQSKSELEEHYRQYGFSQAALTDIISSKEYLVKAIADVVATEDEKAQIFTFPNQDKNSYTFRICLMTKQEAELFEKGLLNLTWQELTNQKIQDLDPAIGKALIELNSKERSNLISVFDQDTKEERFAIIESISKNIVTTRDSNQGLYSKKVFLDCVNRLRGIYDIDVIKSVFV